VGQVIALYENPTLADLTVVKIINTNDLNCFVVFLHLWRTKMNKKKTRQTESGGQQHGNADLEEDVERVER